VTDHAQCGWRQPLALGLNPADGMFYANLGSLTEYLFALADHAESHGDPRAAGVRWAAHDIAAIAGKVAPYAHP
jgi:hypothetical protein